MQIARAVKASGKVGPRSGLVRMVVYVTPEHLGAVVDEGQRRAREAGRVRADASEVVREALDAWIGRRK
jgi:hypothetical protein